MMIHQHEIDAEIEMAMQTKLRYNSDWRLVVVKRKTSHRAKKCTLGFFYDDELNVGDVGESPDGSVYEVLAIV